jgi:hypothetical protein
MQHFLWWKHPILPALLEQLFHFWFKLDLFRLFLFLSFALLTLSDVFHIRRDFLDKSTILLGSLPYEFVHSFCRSHTNSWIVVIDNNRRVLLFSCCQSRSHAPSIASVVGSLAVVVVCCHWGRIQSLCRCRRRRRVACEPGRTFAIWGRSHRVRMYCLS